jgi:hypothetical protein
MKYPIHPEFTLFEFTLIRILHSQLYSNIRIIRIRFPALLQIRLCSRGINREVLQ